MVGDWKGSIYDVGGRRWDYHLFLDRDGRYERTVSGEQGEPRRDAGRWEFDEKNEVLSLLCDPPDTTEPFQRKSGEWWVLSVTKCEKSNVLLVLREAILASRNLPVLFYRVHGDGRAYGTNWQERHKIRLDT